MRWIVKGTALWIGFLLGFVGISGCSGDHNEATREVEQAAGVQTTKEVTTAKQKKDYLYIDEKKVVDVETGKTVSDKKVVTPVTVETSVKKDVDVKTGEAQTSPPPKK